jgi:hypothetical protein
MIPVQKWSAKSPFPHHRYAQRTNAYLLMHVQFPEDLGGIQQMCVIQNSVIRSVECYFQHPLFCSKTSCSSKNPGAWSAEQTYFLTLNARSGRFSKSAIQYPLIRNKNVRNPWTAASGTMYVFRRLQRSIGLI